MTADTRWEEDQQLVRNLLNTPHLPPIPGPICPRACSAGRVSAPHLPTKQMQTQIPQLHRRRALNWNQTGSWRAAPSQPGPSVHQPSLQRPEGFSTTQRSGVRTGTRTRTATITVITAVSRSRCPQHRTPTSE